MIEQFRYPIGKVMIEIPAGKRNHAENSKITASRELLEETGYAAKSIKKIGQFYPCIGYSNEFIDVYHAKGLSYKSQSLDSGEFLNVFTMTGKEIDKSIRSGKITDAKTISAWMIFKSKTSTKNR